DDARARGAAAAVARGGAQLRRHPVAVLAARRHPGARAVAARRRGAAVRRGVRGLRHRGGDGGRHGAAGDPDDRGRALRPGARRAPERGARAQPRHDPGGRSGHGRLPPAATEECPMATLTPAPAVLPDTAPGHGPGGRGRPRTVRVWRGVVLVIAALYFLVPMVT